MSSTEVVFRSRLSECVCLRAEIRITQKSDGPISVKCPVWAACATRKTCSTFLSEQDHSFDLILHM